MPCIIFESQTVYVNKRFISEGGRLIDDLPEICDVFNRQGSLVTIDIEKASNSVSINLLQLRYLKNLVMEIQSL